MKYKTKLLMFMIYGLGLAMVNIQSAEAVVLDFSPSSQIAVNGDAVSLDLRISGLTNGGAPSLGDFDISIAFDTTKLSFSSYSLGSFLGAISLSEASDFSLGLSGGAINLSEVSYLSPGALDSLQADSFTLATLHFTVDNLSSGQSTSLSISNVHALGDGFGNPLTIDSISNAQIKNGVSVPEPSAFLLICTFLTCLFLSRQKFDLREPRNTSKITQKSANKLSA